MGDHPIGEAGSPESTTCLRCAEPIEACAACVAQWRAAFKLIAGFGMRATLETRHRCAA